MDPVDSVSPTVGRVILNDTEVSRTLTRMAHQIVESDPDGPLLLLGIPTRGVPLAHRLAEAMRQVDGRDVAVGQLDVTMYRDDLRGQPTRAVGRTVIPGLTGSGTDTIDGVTVVLVDDVLYSGRTIRAALDALSDLGRPRAVRLAVLVDRGHRQLPIRADHVGKNLPTAAGERVRVRLAESDQVTEVRILPPVTSESSTGESR